MILWFAGVSFVFVWWVFKSPALDFRLVMLGSVLPVGEVVLGGPACSTPWSGRSPCSPS